MWRLKIECDILGGLGYSGLNISSKKGVETKMKTTVSFYGKGNEGVF